MMIIIMNDGFQSSTYALLLLFHWLVFFCFAVELVGVFFLLENDTKAPLVGFGFFLHLLSYNGLMFFFFFWWKFARRWWLLKKLWFTRCVMLIVKTNKLDLNFFILFDNYLSNFFLIPIENQCNTEKPEMFSSYWIELFHNPNVRLSTEFCPFFFGTTKNEKKSKNKTKTKHFWRGALRYIYKLYFGVCACLVMGYIFFGNACT